MRRVNPLETLTAINLDDLVNAFGWQERPFLARAARRIFSTTARSFAQQMLDFDAAIGECGMAEAACLTERLYARDVRVFGSELLPKGPFLALANHPGLTDTLALFASLERRDLKIIALNRPFLMALPNLSKQLFFVTENPAERVSLVRRVSSFLRAGGSLLTFPAGHTEPDPDVYRGAIESLSLWADSVEIFIRLAPETAVIPVCVRGVASEYFAHHPLTRLRRTADDQQLLASVLQLLWNVIFRARPVTVRVQIGHPISIKEIGSTAMQLLHETVLAEMKRLMASPPVGNGVSVL